MYRSSSINTFVKAPVVLCGHTSEGILHTGASDTTVSHAVVRRLGLVNVIVSTDATFLTAGRRTEGPNGCPQGLSHQDWQPRANPDGR